MAFWNRKKNNTPTSSISASGADGDLLSASQFYIDCVEDYHNTAKKQGKANNGLVFIPELIPIGEKTILAFLKDPFFSAQFGNNPQMLYYVIMSLSIQAGIVFAAKWHEDFSALKNGYVDQIIEEGPADACKPYLSQLGLSSSEKENTFYQTIFERWLDKHEPYWKLRDPRDYTFKATLAAYQLGISMILEKYGYGKSEQPKNSVNVIPRKNGTECNLQRNGESAPPSLPPLSQKDLDDYSILEPIEVLQKNDATDDLNESSRIIAETPDYYVYSYNRKSVYANCLIRRSKRNLDEIVYLGFNYPYSCLFDGKIFYITSGSFHEKMLGSIDVATGATVYQYGWFSEKIHFYGDVGTYQDNVKSLRVEDGKLLITVERKKSGHPFLRQKEENDDLVDVDMDYTLCVSMDEGKYRLARFYTAINTSMLQVVDYSPKRKWNIAKAKDSFFLIDRDNNIAKTRKGYVLYTLILDLAKSMADDLERYGEKAPEMSFISLQSNMHDNIRSYPPQEVKTRNLSCFKFSEDWTFQIKFKNSEWAKLIGNESERKSIILSWLSKANLMQMNDIFTLGKKYNSINLPFILAAIIENCTASTRAASLRKFEKYVNRNNDQVVIARNDIDVFSSYYEISLARSGATTKEIVQDIDFDSLFL